MPRILHFMWVTQIYPLRPIPFRPDSSIVQSRVWYITWGQTTAICVINCSSSLSASAWHGTAVYTRGCLQNQLPLRQYREAQNQTRMFNDSRSETTRPLRLRSFSVSSNSASPLSLANSHHRHWRVAACAECCLFPEYLSDPSVDWLWPEHKAVLGRLQRLGMSSFTAVATVPEKVCICILGRSRPFFIGWAERFMVQG